MKNFHVITFIKNGFALITRYLKNESKHVTASPLTILMNFYFFFQSCFNWYIKHLKKGFCNVLDSAKSASGFLFGVCADKYSLYEKDFVVILLWVYAFLIVMALFDTLRSKKS